MTGMKKTTPERRPKPSLSSTSQLLRLSAKTGAYAFYRWENVAINLWASQPTATAVTVMTELTERSVSECPGGIASIHCVEEGVGLPTAEARVGLGELAKSYPKHVICVGVILQGSGFWASATRSALTGIMLLAPRSFALRFFGDPSELCAYVVHELAQRGQSVPGAERLMAVFAEAQADFRRLSE
jgi:predicted nucleic acid-binding Zn ribbon protein